MTDPTQPQPTVDDDGQIRVRCDRPGISAVSNVIGDASDVLVWIAELCDIAGLEYDDAELPDKVVISIPPGA